MNNDEQGIEQAIQEAGKTALRVTPGVIDALMKRVQYVTERVGLTNTMVVHAFLDGRFRLASGYASCVSAENFDPSIGERIARGHAERDARDKLWEVEGYRLYADPASLLPATTAMTFSQALDAAKRGVRIARQGWNGKDLYVEAQFPDANSKMTLPYLFMVYPTDARNTPGAKVPWLASQTDLLAEDWIVVFR